ncbi:hypothetical protein H8E07_20655 [bacterium]|nr:hypothetical protein [bacterium]
MARENREFQAQLLSWKEIHALPDGWPSGQLQFLLKLLDVDGVSDEEALDMAVLALQDRDHDEAAELVLETVFRESMRPGLRRNLSHDLTDERPWEDFADITQQAGIFNASVLLQQAFPLEYGVPDAVSVVVRLDTARDKGRVWLGDPKPDPALLARILANGMDERAVLRRLFGDSLRGARFEEAHSILWRSSRNAGMETAFDFTLFSSHQWFDPLKDLDSWAATAWPDARATQPE